MKNKLLISFLLTSFLGFSQIPDYSKLSRKEKLKYMNVYGFVELKIGDTILTKVKYNSATNVPLINANHELVVSYPDELEKYEYQKKIPLNSIHKFYFGFPRKFNVVKPYKNGYINLEKIDNGKYHLYKHNSISGGSIISVPSSGGFSTIQTSPEIHTTLYISKKEGKLICIEGGKEEKMKILKLLLKDEIGDNMKFSKIKTRNRKVIELIKRINRESKDISH